MTLKVGITTPLTTKIIAFAEIEISRCERSENHFAIFIRPNNFSTFAEKSLHGGSRLVCFTRSR